MLILSASHVLCLQWIQLCKKLSNKQSGSVIFRPVRPTTDRKRISVVKLSAAHTFNLIVLGVKFGMTSYKKLPPALF